MRERKLKAEVLEVILESANLFDDSVRVRNNNYSGRSMYGAECFGLVFYADSDMFKFVAVAGMVSTERERDGDEGFHTEDAIALVNVARTDSMAGDTILYFPGWTLDGWTNDDTDEEI